MKTQWQTRTVYGLVFRADVATASRRVRWFVLAIGTRHGLPLQPVTHGPAP